MARRNDIEVGVTGVADFRKARKDAAKDLDRIEKDAKSTADDIERAFDRVELSPELDTAEIRQALDWLTSSTAWLSTSISTLISMRSNRPRR